MVAGDYVTRNLYKYNHEGTGHYTCAFVISKFTKLILQEVIHQYVNEY